MAHVVVVGGGVVGASAAYRLVRRGIGTTLISRGDEGQATAAGAGIIAPGITLRTDTVLEPLLIAAANYYPEFIRQLEDDGESNTGYDTPGELFVAMNHEEEAQLPWIMKLAEERRARGVPGIGDIRRLDGEQAVGVFPPLADTRGAIWVSGTSRVDGRLLRDALWRAIRARGGTVIEGNARPVREGDRVVRVEVNSQTIASDAIILAGGAWSSSFGQDIGLSVPVYPQRGQIIHLSLPGVDTSHWPVVTGFHSHYMLAFPPNRVVVGATREHTSGYDYRATAGGVHAVLSEALRVAPGLAAATLAEIRIGMRPASPDGRPMLGRVSKLSNVFLATGNGPSGLQLGPYCGAAVADLACGEAVSVDLAPFAVDRFARPVNSDDGSQA
jgi:D-amino-acid dehydrogenase